MKILVLSDSHSALRFMRSCVDAVKPDAIIHLGDHYDDAQALAEEYPHIPMHAVPGNCDWSDEPAERVENLGGVDVLMMHGHTRGVKMSLMSLACLAQEKGVRAALFGHTHAPYMAYEYGVLLLNPGALQDEKCALLEIEKGEIRGRLLNINKIC